jgi:hypothetical protein
MILHILTAMAILVLAAGGLLFLAAAAPLVLAVTVPLVLAAAGPLAPAGLLPPALAAAAPAFLTAVTILVLAMAPLLVLAAAALIVLAAVAPIIAAAALLRRGEVPDPEVVARALGGPDGLFCAPCRASPIGKSASATSQSRAPFSALSFARVVSGPNARHSVRLMRVATGPAIARSTSQKRTMRGWVAEPLTTSWT